MGAGTGSVTIEDGVAAAAGEQFMLLRRNPDAVDLLLHRIVRNLAFQCKDCSRTGAGRL